MRSAADRIKDEEIKTLEEYSRRIAIELKVVGLINVQYAIQKGKVYILEANPRCFTHRASCIKVTGVSMARIATQVLLGVKLKDIDTHRRKYSHFGVKEAVFPFNMFLR